MYFDMSYLKLWSLLSSSALISANHTSKIVTLRLLTKSGSCFVHNIAWWAEEMFALDRKERLLAHRKCAVYHASDVKKSTINTYNKESSHTFMCFLSILFAFSYSFSSVTDWRRNKEFRRFNEFASQTDRQSIYYEQNFAILQHLDQVITWYKTCLKSIWPFSVSVWFNQSKHVLNIDSNGLQIQQKVLLYVGARVENAPKLRPCPQTQL